MTLTLDRETLSPKRAAEYLEANDHNRNLRRPLVEKLVGAIHRGEWIETGDPIKFNGDRLIDGQHRLAAIAKAGQRVPVWIARGLTADAQEVVDTGSKRTVGDMLKLRGYGNWNQLAASARSLYEYRAHGIPRGEAGTIPPTHQELLHVVENEAALETCAMKARQFRRQDPALGLSPGVVTAMWVVFSERTDEADADAFFAQLLGPTDPAPKLLRQRLLQAGPHRQLPGQLKAALLIKTWNYWIQGERPKTLAWRAGGRAKEPFPQVEGRLQ